MPKHCLKILGGRDAMRIEEYIKKSSGERIEKL